MATEYETFVTSLDELKQGQEVDLTIRDTETYESKKVKAIVFSDKATIPDGDILWIRFSRGLLNKEPWCIKITKELGGVI